VLSLTLTLTLTLTFHHPPEDDVLAVEPGRPFGAFRVRVRVRVTVRVRVRVRARVRVRVRVRVTSSHPFGACAKGGVPALARVWVDVCGCGRECSARKK
jgi:hypothetical protein